MSNGIRGEGGILLPLFLEFFPIPEARSLMLSSFTVGCLLFPLFFPNPDA
jgi:hypothetical protein